MSLPRPFAPLAALVLLSACTNFQQGAPVASTKVHSVSPAEIEAVATEAFEKIGFHFVSSTRGEMILERPASRTDEVLYGSWNSEKKSSERVIVRILQETKPGTYSVSAAPYTVRDPNSGMEDVSRRFTLFAHDYDTAIKEIHAKLNAR